MAVIFSKEIPLVVEYPDPDEKPDGNVEVARAVPCPPAAVD